MKQEMTQPIWAWPLAALGTLSLMLSSAICANAQAQGPAVTQQQQSRASEVAQSGLPLSELAPNAPDSYTVKRGDTLWGISGIFLTRPWRWPELWGMNLQEIRNPHLIFPGQRLFLEKKDGRVSLRTNPALQPEAGPIETVRVSPRTRYDLLPNDALPTLKTHLIAPFLAEPMIVGEGGLMAAPRIVAAQDGRVLLTRGDRAYALGPEGTPLLDEPEKKQKAFRILRNATALKDPQSGEVLGYEAQFVGRALLARGEARETVTSKDGKPAVEIVPATIDIVEAKEEMRVGDRLLPEPEREIMNYTPHAAPAKMDARIVSVYGSAVANAAQNQVVAINRGTRDGVASGQIMAIMKDGARLIDKTDPARPLLKLPDERNGLLMVFRTFERLSYALVLEITEGVKVGDRLLSPR
jgi:hypothetical protein